MKILVKVFYTSLREDLAEILGTCCERPVHDLVRVRVGSSWWSPGEILSVSLHDLVHVLVRKILWRYVEILLKSSSKGPLIKILKILCVGACMTSGVLIGSSCIEDLVTSCELLCIDLYRRSCRCSCANV